MSRSVRFLNAMRLRQADCTPVWFMRQAGRYMPEYRRIREKHGLLEMFKNPEIAAEVTLQPVQALGVDAAIIFADILLPLEAMGLGLEFVEGEGPILRNPVRSRRDAEALRIPDPEESLGYVLKSLRIVRGELDGKVPLIGFAGAPFTLAGYAIEGGGSRSFTLTKRLMYEHRETWEVLMGRVTEAVTAFLLKQASAGAQALQLFDSWVGCLSPADYLRYVQPYSQAIFSSLAREGIPAIHFGTGTGDLLPLMSAAGGDVIGADWRIWIDDAWSRVGSDRGIQGNLDPAVLLAPWPVVEEKAGEIIDRVLGRSGYIFNLGHGILPQTPVDNVRRLADFVHERTGDSHSRPSPGSASPSVKRCSGDTGDCPPQSKTTV
jgi:uroporphyrinogen decarboxylase